MTLAFRKEAGDREDYDVLSGSMVVGRIYRREHLLPDAPPWAWSISGVKASLGVMVSNGSTDTLDQAKAELGKNWRKWLGWAALTEESRT